MRALLQRVGAARVEVRGETVGAIDSGLLIYLGCERGDGESEARRLAERVARFRMFDDADGKTNLDLAQAGGGVLIVPQFTLVADTRKGNRPSFSRALEPAKAERLCDMFGQVLKNKGFTVEFGQFGASMMVAAVNQGPVNFLLRTPPDEAHS